jgi:sugar O-acyltransferase (sialic acid O-acetyltransferase NeuD family)
MNKPLEQIYIVGAGGHGKVAVRAAQAAGKQVVAIFDDNPAKWNSVISGVTVVGPVEAICQRESLPTLLAIGDNALRLLLAEKLPLSWASVIHPAAYVDESARIGSGVLILPGAVVHVDAIVGDHTIVNSNATIEHDCRIGEGAHVSCRACLTGGVQVGRGALIGAGAVVLPGIQVHDFARVGAGAVVTRHVESATTVVGVPAKVLMPRHQQAA